MENYTKKYIENYKVGKVGEKYIKEFHYNKIHHLIGPVGSGKDVDTLLKTILYTDIKQKCCNYLFVSLMKDNNYVKTLREVGFLGTDLFSEGFSFNSKVMINERIINNHNFNTNIKGVLLDYFLDNLENLEFDGIIIDKSELYNETILNVLKDKLGNIEKYNISPYNNGLIKKDIIILSNGFDKLKTEGVIYEYKPDGDSLYAENLDNLPSGYYSTIIKFSTSEDIKKLVRVNYSKYL